ncbi:MAG TPA: hypothetical protein VHZ50_05235 [Puia sp.]|nr:hypothetical protein [Puia sp.]
MFNAGALYQMDKRNTTPVYFQIPKLLHEDKRIKAQHIYIFMVLYDQLRQRELWNKTNQWISEQTKLGIRQVKIYLNELEEWGYLTRSGLGSSRKLSLGIKLIDRAESVPVSKEYRAESVPIQGGIGTSNRAESELHSKNLFKNIIKNISSPQNQPQKTNPKHPDPTDEQKKLMDDFKEGKDQNDIEKQTAKHLIIRYEKQKEA